MIIIGAGISGLAAARQLEKAHVDWLLLESSDQVGGRIRTDTVNDALLDRGFQVLNDGYPALQDCVDITALELAAFQPGARIHSGSRLLSFQDPRRRPLSALAGFRRSPARPSDMAALARLGLANAGNAPRLLETTCLQALAELGFSEGFIGDFIAPFFRAVFLNRELDIEWRHMRELLLMFSRGQATLPAAGMQALPREMAAGLDVGKIHCGRRVSSLAPGQLRLADGGSASCSLVILATQPTAAAGLLGRYDLPSMQGVRSLHFSAPQSPSADPVLYLSGRSENGPVCNLAIPGNLHPAYDFGAASQVLASSLDMDSRPAELEGGVRKQLQGWFGNAVQSWELVHVNEVSEALPRPSTLDSLPGNEELLRDRQLLLCGDYPGTPSINRALESGNAAGNLAAMHLRSGTSG